MTEKLEAAGKTGQWFSIYKCISSDEMPERWNVTELSPDDSPVILANKLVDHFSKCQSLAYAQAQTHTLAATCPCTQIRAS